MRLPKGKLAFRLTHRFLRTMGDGDFSDLASRLFGFDSGAQIGLDLKYAPFSGAQLGIYRTSDRTIQFQGQYNVVKDGDGPIGVGLVVNVDGTDNFSDEFSPGAAVLLFARALATAAPSTCNRNMSATAGCCPATATTTPWLWPASAPDPRRSQHYCLWKGPSRRGPRSRRDDVRFGFEQQAGADLFQ